MNVVINALIYPSFTVFKKKLNKVSYVHQSEKKQINKVAD